MEMLGREGMVIMSCPSDVLSYATGCLAIIRFVYRKSAVRTYEHFEIALRTEGIPYVLSRFGHHILLKVVVLVVPICCPALSVASVFTRERDNFFAQLFRETCWDVSWRFQEW